MNIARSLKHAEKKILIGWIRFARRHRESNRLPVFLFLLLFFDAFVMVIPSMVLTAAAVTISPRRWLMYAAIFVTAVICNNTVSYFLGRLFPVEQILAVVDWMGLGQLWFAAEEAILSYGKFATLPGGLLGLPTQLITMIIGVADSQAYYSGRAMSASLEEALFYGAIGHGIKMIVICGLVRYGWIKLERKYGGASL